jgi:hypothetical protein
MKSLFVRALAHAAILALATALNAAAAVAASGATRPTVTDIGLHPKTFMFVGNSFMYTIAGNANNALVVPAGLAFANARAKQPGIGLYVKDKRHPTLAGTYLAAATIYSAFYRKPAPGAGPEGLSPDTTKFLQSVAWQTVQDYYRK